MIEILKIYTTNIVQNIVCVMGDVLKNRQIARITWLNSHFFPDAELDNFVGQEPVNNNQPQFSSNTYEPPPTNASPPSNESKNTANQPTRQGYFTSILSSLPNLSLSSNKNDSPGTQINQTPENISGTAQQESNPYAFSQERHGSQPDASGFVATNLPSTSSTDLSGFATFDLAGTLPNPPQSTVPPSLSVFKDGEYLGLAYN